MFLPDPREIAKELDAIEAELYAANQRLLALMPERPKFDFEKALSHVGHGDD